MYTNNIVLLVAGCFLFSANSLAQNYTNHYIVKEHHSISFDMKDTAAMGMGGSLHNKQLPFTTKKKQQVQTTEDYIIVRCCTDYAIINTQLPTHIKPANIKIIVNRDTRIAKKINLDKDSSFFLQYPLYNIKSKEKVNDSISIYHLDAKNAFVKVNHNLPPAVRPLIFINDLDAGIIYVSIGITEKKLQSYIQQHSLKVTNYATHFKNINENKVKTLPKVPEQISHIHDDGQGNKLIVR